MSIKFKLIAPVALLVAFCVAGIAFIALGLQPLIERREEHFFKADLMNRSAHGVASAFSDARISAGRAAQGGSKHLARLDAALTKLKRDMDVLRQSANSEAVARGVDAIAPLIEEWRNAHFDSDASAGVGSPLLRKLAESQRQAKLAPYIENLREASLSHAIALQHESNLLIESAVSRTFSIFAAVGCFAAALAMHLSHSISWPLSRLIKQARDAAEGATVRNFEPLPRRDEIGVLSRALFSMVQAIRARIREVETIAFTDPATGLPNNQRLLQTARRLIEQERQGATLLLMRIDRAEQLEGVFGAAAFDELIAALGRRLREVFDDANVKALVGGDVLIVRAATAKLAVLVGGDAGRMAAAQDKALARRILARLQQPLELDLRRAKVTLDLAVASAPRDAVTAEALCAAANIALAHAVSEPSIDGRLARFASTMREQAVARRAIEERLRDALEREEFVVYFQPKVSSSTLELVGAEALIRWNDRDKGLISPAEFIPIAEQTGLISMIDDWVLRRACMQTRAWLDSGVEIAVSVNVSAARFEQDDFADAVIAALDDSDLPAERLELELTETLAMAAPARTAAMLAPLRALGVRVAIDDFGSGYSSLSKLGALPIDCVKIDRSLLPEDSNDRDAATIMAAAVSMARSLQLETVSEGVETPWQHAYVRGLGCSLIQGVHFSRPLNSADFAPFAAEFATRRSVVEQQVG